MITTFYAVVIKTLCRSRYFELDSILSGHVEKFNANEKMR